VKADDLGNSRFLNLIFKPAGLLMESRVRRWLMNPSKTLHGADLQPGQTILEVGSGTGFFTLPAARIIGDEGCLIAMEPLADYAKRISEKAQRADLTNIRVVQRDALDTGLESATMDTVLLFGVIPFPLLPLNRLLPEMRRVLKPEGTMAVWLFPPLVHSWVPKSILQSGLFTHLKKHNGVHNYRAC
jgi:demethylmenaquinone methyltransferase/2-methoxy-6-polyprenyl-1,4-benzoquinol methylase